MGRKDLLSQQVYNVIIQCNAIKYIRKKNTQLNQNSNEHLRGYHTLQGDNCLKSVERFDHMMFVCRFQASR